MGIFATSVPENKVYMWKQMDITKLKKLNKTSAWGKQILLSQYMDFKGLYFSEMVLAEMKENKWK